MHVKYLTYVSNLEGIFVTGTCFAITFEVEVTVGCVMVYVCKNVGFIAYWNVVAIFLG